MKSLILFLASVFMISISSVCVKAQNTPPSDWAKESIATAQELKITDNTKVYSYTENISREEFCELIYNLINVSHSDIRFVDALPVLFDDTDNQIVMFLNKLGIIEGKSDSEFAPYDFLTREEAATIIIRMVNKIMPMPATEMWFEYEDIDSISEWAVDSVQTISNMGFMNGVGDNKFAPKDTYTVEQAIATLVRVYTAAESSGVLDTKTVIIGGEDGPSQVYIGDNIFDNEDVEALCSHLGKTKDEFISEFDISGANIEIDGSQELYTISYDSSADISFAFYNGYLVAVDYRFNNIEPAYHFAKHIRNEIGANFGEKTTYPGGNVYLDDLNSPEEVEPMYCYYEDWTVAAKGNHKETIMKYFTDWKPAITDELASEIAGERAFSRIDLTLQLKALPNGYANVTVKYVILP